MNEDVEINLSEICGRINKGDNYTIQGVFKRRTFWQWLLRKPKNKELLRFKVTNCSGNDITIKPPYWQ